MKVFFVVAGTSLAAARLAARRRRLAQLLRARSVELQTFRAGPEGLAGSRLAMAARGETIIVVDDYHALPDRAPWLAQLVKHASDLADARRPYVVYVTRRTSAAGADQALRHPLVRHYLQRDDAARWVDAAAEAALCLIEDRRSMAAAEATPAAPAGPQIVGTSPGFREAVQDLGRLLRQPYGLVTGPCGAGKLFLLRTLWERETHEQRVIVLACGSFFRDYYVAGIHRRFSQGRECLDQLVPFLREAHESLLVLHHVELLPTAIQEEVATRMDLASGGPTSTVRFLNFDRQGIVEYDVKLVATSTLDARDLAAPGRLVPDLARLLLEHHVAVPSLAERGEEDVRLLCEDLLVRMAAREKLPAVPRLDPPALDALTRGPWPGNLTDLTRVLEKAVHAARGGVIRRQHLPEDLAAASWCGPPLSLKQITAQAQRQAILNALELEGGRITEVSKRLRVDKGTLYRHMHKLRIPIAHGKRQG